MKHENALRRLKTVEGHLRGIQKMIERGDYCIDVIQQVQAVQAALNKVNSIILEEHLNTCLINAVRGNDPEAREQVLKEIMEIFETASKL